MEQGWQYQKACKQGYIGMIEINQVQRTSLFPPTPLSIKTTKVIPSFRSLDASIMVEDNGLSYYHTCSGKLVKV